MVAGNNLKDIIKKIHNGRAVLFVGAGFSQGAIGFNGELPVSNKLRDMICKLMNRPEDDERKLSEIADFFIEGYCKDNPEKLKEFIKQMKDTFTVKEVKSYHVSIASLPWRRIYTTNYDNVVEEAAKKSDIRIESKDLEDSFIDEENICLHINGKIEKLNKGTLENSFKLTSSSYISYDAFNNTEWKKYFINDLELASVVVFIGYSLYDIDIEKILYHNNLQIKDKVVFIHHEGIDEIDKFKYEKYGKVHSIGVEKFAQLIEQNTFVCAKEDIFFERFRKIEYIGQSQSAIAEQDVRDFLICGKIKDKMIEDEIIRQRNKPPFLIFRDKIDNALENIKNGKKMLVVIGDVGNGKTIFLKQLATRLASSRQVFMLSATGDEVAAKRDIDKIAKNNKEPIVIIDSYVRHTYLLEYIKLHYEHLTIILAARTHEHYRYLKENEYLNKACILEIDTLSDSELECFYRIIEYNGIWYPSSEKNNQRYTENYKKAILSDKCKKEIALILIEVLNSEQMKEKIVKILNDLFSKQISRKQVFAICLLNLMDIPISIGLLEEIVGEHDLTIYQDENLENIIGLNLINRGNEVFVKSPIFSLLILKIYFANEAIEYFLDILRLIGKKSNRDGQLNLIRKNLFRFRFIERLLLDSGKIDKLKNYYESLKLEFEWLIQDPQYWLQYAMCFMMYNELDQAQQKLSTAYEKAEKTNYDKTKIDNQQARLYLKKSVNHNINIKEAMRFFLEADKLLMRQKNNDTYKYKIMMDYRDFIDERSSLFDLEQWNQVIGCCEKQLRYLDGNITKERFREQRVYEECKEMLEAIIYKGKQNKIGQV
ncbi:SIR2 family protein [Campylobacter lari]|uniref:SIR2 family protein n=1 Tax=Campylobacter lari TaxID=201 RepID=UPI0021530DD4|nr:SIR2 family protein [Campylobacter lari]MCR6519648.1 SIR2 family protein [Campylobacter lari]